MKPLESVNLLRTPVVIKTLAFISLSIAFFYLGKRWSESDGYQQLIFFSSPASSSAAHRRPPSVALSPNLGKTFNLSSIISQGAEQSVPPPADALPPDSSATATAEPVAASPPPPPPIPPPPPPQITRFGIVDENGTMSDDFEVGEFDPDFVEDWKTNGSETEASGTEAGGGGGRITIKKYHLCPESMREYIPCLDNVEAIKRLNSTEKGERFERHCPDKDKGLNCLVPSPQGYRPPIPWPRSRNEVWYYNVPHTRLVEDKGGQNWIFKEKNKFKFPGGGTQFIHGADEYLNQMSQMVFCYLKSTGCSELEDTLLGLHNQFINMNLFSKNNGKRC
ncbi:hypothetical protein CRG98_007206 [Punica granatum]|uniref:Methyltransferase n=1 Tax=Punica granatum TaxID=22663 RepID=A0A2I0KWV5_PUNGR|nr:hypothetical protein CRG98_007206 [Punica granatum]